MPPADEIEICPCAFGSGKFGTPFLRMQAANLVIACTLPPAITSRPPPPGAGAPPADEEPPGVFAVVPVPAVVVVPRLATDAPGFPPPQPATSKPREASTAAARAGRANHVML